MNPRERIQFLKGSPALKFENLVIENSNFNFQYSTIPRTFISHVHAALLIAATCEVTGSRAFLPGSAIADEYFPRGT